ncbi:MAG: hypothetical protein GY775_19135 [Candidatus Scalindua sp.]|nr:hypothetical protein [Candidatus Scalindua sp.]
MARNNFFSVYPTDTNTDGTRYQVEAGATPILAGEPVIQDPASPQYVIAAPDGADNTSTWIGVAQTNSTETATGDGQVSVTDDPKVLYRGKALDPSILSPGISNTKVTVSLVGDQYTVNAGTTLNGVLTLHEVNAAAGTVDFRISASATLDN